MLQVAFIKKFFNMLKNEFVTDYLINGISYIKDYTILDWFSQINFGKIANVSTDQSFKEYTETQKLFLAKVSEYLYNNYVLKFRVAELISCDIWDGVDDYSLDWHVDNKNKQDFSFLYYLDDSDANLYFMDTESGIESCVSIEAGTLVWLNQSSKYRHKAERSTQKRRMINVQFKY